MLSKVHILLYTISRRLAKRHRGFYRFSSKKVGKKISSDNKYYHSKFRMSRKKSMQTLNVQVSKLDKNPTFGTLFLEAPKTHRFQPSIAFRGAKHCFSPEKASLLSTKSIARLYLGLFSLQNKAKKCSKLLISA